MSEKMRDDWADAMATAKAIDKDKLIRALMQHIARTRKRPMWSYIREATSHGSTVSCAICRTYGIDPDTGRVLE